MFSCDRYASAIRPVRSTRPAGDPARPKYALRAWRSKHRADTGCRCFSTTSHRLMPAGVRFPLHERPGRRIMTLSFNDSTPKEIAMLGIGRRDGSVEVQPSVKTVL